MTVITTTLIINAIHCDYILSNHDYNVHHTSDKHLKHECDTHIYSLSYIYIYNTNITIKI